MAGGLSCASAEGGAVKPGEPIGKFQILGTLGQGAHSTILHVRRQGDSTQYALKVVPIDGPEEVKFLEQIEHEFHISQKLDHPNLIKIYSLETQKDWLFRVKKALLLSEYVNGKTLDQVPPLSLPKLVRVFEQVAAALTHMHRQGVLHADMKPNNVMLSRSGEVKVLDYGLAWVKGEPKQRLQGTPEYMAPETAKRKLINERTDIFNFGATMYRLVTFRLPPPTVIEEDIKLDGELWERQLKPVSDFNAAAPKELADLIHHCLSFDALRRPERMSEVQGELDRIADKLAESGSGSHKVLEW
jgi:serine/threonine protein kinase